MRFYITIKLNSPEDTGSVVDLIVSKVRSSCLCADCACDVLVYKYIGELICFSFDTAESNRPEVIKKVRRLSRGKIRFKVLSTIDEVAS